MSAAVLKALSELPHQPVGSFTAEEFPDLLSRIAAHTRIDRSSGCFVFGKGKGQPNLRYKGRNYRPTRIVFEMREGTLGASDVVRHECYTLRCIRPDHLRLPVRTEPPEPKRLSIVERIYVAQRVIAARHAPKPVLWATIAAREGVPERTLQDIYAMFQGHHALFADRSGTQVLDETLLLYSESIRDLATEAVNGETGSVRVQALTKMLEAAKGRVELLAATGKITRNFRAAEELARLHTLIRRLGEIVEQHNLPVEVVNDFIDLIDDLRAPDVIEGTAQRSLPE